MKNIQNENVVDRIIRFLVAAGTAIAALYSHGAARNLWIVVVAIALISSLSGFSLFYWLIGIKTLRERK